MVDHYKAGDTWVTEKEAIESLHEKVFL
jgi:hypothetical protein